MSAIALLQRLEKAGVRPRVSDGRLFLVPGENVPDQLKDEARRLRGELLTRLGDEPLPAFRTRREWAETCWALFRARAAMLEAQGLLARQEAERGAWRWLEGKLDRGPAPPQRGEKPQSRAQF